MKWINDGCNSEYWEKLTCHKYEPSNDDAHIKHNLAEAQYEVPNGQDECDGKYSNSNGIHHLRCLMPS